MMRHGRAEPMRAGVAFLRDRSASVAVEFAIVTPVVVLLCAGILIVGNAFSVHRKARAAAGALAEIVPFPRERVAFESFVAGAQGIQRTVLEATLFPMPADAATYTYEVSAPSSASVWAGWAPVRVKVSYRFDPRLFAIGSSLGLSGGFLEDVLTIEATSADVQVKWN